MPSITHPNILLDALENGVMIIDEEGKIYYWNRWLEINTGHDNDDICGQKLQDLYPQIDYPTLQRKIRTTIRLNSPTFYDTTFQNRFISIKRMKISASLLPYMQLQVTISPYLSEHKMVMVSVYDISDLYELKIELQNKMAEIERLNALLEQENERVETLAVTDPLTTLYNRLKFDEVFRLMLLRENWEPNNTFAIILIDIDHFKKVNDTYGHLIGDRILVLVAEALRTTVRVGDIVARWGGEEFIVLIPNVNEKKALIAAEKLRSRIETMEIQQVPQVTASFGVTLYRKGDTQQQMLQRADEGLYQAKANGRNGIELVPSSF